MRMFCYSTRSDPATREQLFQYTVQGGGWISNLDIRGFRLYIPETHRAWALLIDSELRRQPELDYIA